MPDISSLSIKYYSLLPTGKVDDFSHPIRNAAIKKGWSPNFGNPDW